LSLQPEHRWRQSPLMLRNRSIRMSRYVWQSGVWIYCFLESCSLHSTFLLTARPLSLPPLQYMISIPLVIGVLIAFAVAMNLAVSFVPSVTSTILKLRCGIIPLFKSPLQEQYRVAPESVAVLIGSLFWGAST